MLSGKSRASLSGSGYPANSFQEKLPVGLEIDGFRKNLEVVDVVFPPAESDDIALIFVVYSGELQVYVNGIRATLPSKSPAAGFLLPANQSLVFKSGMPANFSLLKITVPMTWVRAYLLDSPGFQKMVESAEADRNIVFQMPDRVQLGLFYEISAQKGAVRGDLLRLQHAVLQLLECFLCRHYTYLPAAGDPAMINDENDLVFIKSVESFISEHFSSDTLTVQSVLGKTNMSYYKLNNLFKSVHNMTISEYIRNRRIERSKEMIVGTTKSVSEIAYEVGYSSISNFILAFKKVYHVTPGEYKKRAEFYTS